jgi:hypothetical protein
MRRKSKAKSGIFPIPTEIPLSTTNARLGPTWSKTTHSLMDCKRSITLPYMIQHHAFHFWFQTLLSSVGIDIQFQVFKQTCPQIGKFEKFYHEFQCFCHNPVTLMLVCCMFIYTYMHTQKLCNFTQPTIAHSRALEKFFQVTWEQMLGRNLSMSQIDFHEKITVRCRKIDQGFTCCHYLLLINTHTQTQSVLTIRNIYPWFCMIISRN